MATVTSFTAERMLQIEAGTIVDARMDGSNLILIKRDGDEIDLGPIKAKDAIPPPGRVYLDSFSGASDDDKLDAAIAYVKAQPQFPAIVLPARPVTFNKTQTTFSGLRILGPGYGWQNPEIKNALGVGGNLVSGTVILGPNIGIETSAWLVGVATTYDVVLSGITFVGTAVQQMYHHDYESSGTCYAGTFHDLTFNNVKHAFGSPAFPMTMTLCWFTGAWTNVGVTDTQYSMRGSDNWLWTAGVLNYGWKGDNGGKYLVRISNMAKSHIHNMYLTARGGSRCVLIEGSKTHQGATIIKDCVFEGQNLDDPAMGALVKQTGGFTSIRDCSVNFYMSDPSQYTDAKDKAAFECSGGTLLLDGMFSAKATGVADTVPVASAYKTGKLRIRNWIGVQGSSINPWAQIPVARQAFAGQINADDSVQVVLPAYLRRTTGVGPGSQPVTIANSAPGGTAWDEIYAVAPSVVRYTGSGTEVLFTQPGVTADRSYLAWTDMEGATKKASIRSWVYVSVAPSSPQPLWQVRSPTNTQSYFGITINNLLKVGWANDITGLSATPGTTALTPNTWYIMHAEIDGGTTDTNGTVNVEFQDALGNVIPGASFALTGQNLGGTNPDVIFGSCRFGRLGNYGTVGDFRMKNFAFQVNTNTVIPAP